MSTDRSCSYTVTAEFDDPDVASEWFDWLVDGHLADVLAAGAVDAEVVELEPDQDEDRRRLTVRYHFPSREAFTVYERDHASRLRADGLARFPVERGIVYARTVGEVRAVRRA